MQMPDRHILLAPDHNGGRIMPASADYIRNKPSITPDLPTGTVTFLFTDIDGKTPLWDREPQTMRPALAQHDAVLRMAFAAHGGQVYKFIGDVVQAAFALLANGVAAAPAAQRELAAVAWPTCVPRRVSVGLRTGPAEPAGDDYVTTHILNRTTASRLHLQRRQHVGRHPHA